MKRKCKNCKRPAVKPFGPMWAVCASEECASELIRLSISNGKAQRKKQFRAEKIEYRKKNKTKGDLTKEAQTEFNKYIRLRDKNRPCISCDKTATYSESIGGEWDCGHYRSVGSAPELRFEPLNAHKQCKRCNNQLSGNVVEYRIRLRFRIGDKKLDWLEGPHEAKRYTREQLIEIKNHYKKLHKELLAISDE